MGNGKGSIYHACNVTGNQIQKLQSIDLTANGQSSDIKQYLYSIENPREYLLDGEDAVLVERGPYPLKKFSINHNFDFRESKLSAAEEKNPNGAVEYDVARAYVILDSNRDLTSNMELDESSLSLSFSGDATSSVTSLEASIPSHLSTSDEITNLSPAFLSIMGAFNDEFNLLLSMSCTKEQIENIPSAGRWEGGKEQCSSSQMNDYDETECTCCMLDATFTIGDRESFLNCNDFLDDSSVGMSTLSLLASYDGGVAVKDAGEPKYDGSGDNFIQTKYKQTSMYSPLIQTHNVNDIFFGYPSALVGKMVPTALLSTAEQLSGTRGVMAAVALLTGQLDTQLPSFTLGNVAAYTKKVGAVCYSTCSAVDATDDLYDSPLGWACSGNARGRYETSNEDEIALGGIDCKPYSSTFATVMQCSAIATHLASDPNDSEYQECFCADGSSDWQSEGCCLAGGKLDGEDLVGNGCLFPVEGVFGPNYAGGSGADVNKINIGSAIEAWIDKVPSKKNSRFMCPAEGPMPTVPFGTGGLEEHWLFNRYETYEGDEAYTSYYATRRSRIQQNDKFLPNATDLAHLMLAMNGSDKTYFPPKGMTLDHSAFVLGTGKSWQIPHSVWVESAKLPVDFLNDKDFGYVVRRAKACGTEQCVEVARMRASDSAFARSDDSDAMGRGLPYDGLQPIGHTSGPSKAGRPAYFHQPVYLNGDKELLSQQNNSHVDTAEITGNGIQIYRPSVEETSDPGIFVVGGINPNYELVQPSTWVAEDKKLRSYFDLEPATGITARSRMRWGTSYSVWECDPNSNALCRLGTKTKSTRLCYQTTAEALGEKMAFACSSSNVMTPKVIGGKILPFEWREEFSKGAERDEVDHLFSFVKEHVRVYHQWFAVAQTLYVIFTIGLAMASLTLCFSRFGKEDVLISPPASD